MPSFRYWGTPIRVAFASTLAASSIATAHAADVAASDTAAAPSPAASAPPVGASAPVARPTSLAPAGAPTPQTLQAVQVTGVRQRLDSARNGLSPDTGSTVYRFDRQDIGNMPLGESTPAKARIHHNKG